jgi:hypothetical protein
MRDPVTFFVFSGKTAFMPLRYLYGECFKLIDPHPQVQPMQCFYKSCPANMNCGETIAKRVAFMFDKVFGPDVKMLIAYFKYRDRPKSVRAAIFRRNMGAPKIMVLNHSAFNKCKREGMVFRWAPSDEYMSLNMSTTGGIIPVENLIRES